MEIVGCIFPGVAIPARIQLYHVPADVRSVHPCHIMYGCVPYQNQKIKGTDLSLPCRFVWKRVDILYTQFQWVIVKMKVDIIWIYLVIHSMFRHTHHIKYH